MDADMVKELMDFHICHIYPDGLTSKQRFAIKRRAESFRIKGTEPLELVGMDPVGKLTVTDGGNQSLNKLVEGQPKRWDHLGTMFGVRTKTQLTTKFSPYFLMLGREARCPRNNGRESQQLGANGGSLRGTQKQEAVFAEVKGNIAKSQDKIRKKKEGGQVGDLVLKRNKRSERRKGGKLEADMLGPFRILNIEGKPEERIPAKLQKVLDPSPLAAPLPPPHQSARHEEHPLMERLIAGPETQAFSWETGLHDYRSSQTDGVYVLRCVGSEEQIQQVQYPVDQEGVASKRFHMAKALVNSSDELSELCRACGEHSKGPRLTNG
ncbi:hypothetical protein KUCAC02_033338 [Chaenocephalus aceratus]|nr:hypothetical protein KUCAC02_033338 [Chaenocephalus aceratus]